MTGNPLPWLVLLGVVVLTLAFKGYIRLPVLRPTSNPGEPSSISGQARNTPASHEASDSVSPAEASLLERLDSRTLGLYFALAKRREAEMDIAQRIAQDAGETIKATFTAPFSTPAPAGQPATPAGVPSS